MTVFSTPKSARHRLTSRTPFSAHWFWTFRQPKTYAGTACSSSTAQNRPTDASQEPLKVCLGLVHRDVGLAKQGAQAGAIAGEQGDPDADTAVQRHVLQGERLVHGRAQLDGHLDGLLLAGVIEQHRELVPTQACQHVCVAQVRAEAPSYLDQELVARAMAQAVLNLLELVQDYHQQSL